jgi:hypothetical protein
LSTYVLLDVELMFKTKFIAFLSVMGFWKWSPVIVGG